MCVCVCVLEIPRESSAWLDVFKERNTYFLINCFQTLKVDKHPAILTKAFVLYCMNVENYEFLRK